VPGVHVGDMARVPPIVGADVVAKRGHFEGDIVFDHDHHPEMFAHAHNVRKEAGNGFGSRVCRNIDIAFFVKPEKHVPHETAGIQRLVPAVREAFDDIQSSLFFFGLHDLKNRPQKKLTYKNTFGFARGAQGARTFTLKPN